MRHVSILFLFLILSADALSWGNNKLSLYECPTITDSMSCSSKCTKRRNDKFEFKVNVNNSIVIRNVYSDGNLFRTDPIENCKVVDEKNWVCLDVSKSDFYSKSFTQTDSMMNGVYSSHGTYSSYYMCGK